MSYVDVELVRSLETLQTLGQAAAAVIPGPAGTAVGVVLEAISIALDAAKAGEDPLAHLKRLRTQDELLSGVRAHILDQLKRKPSERERDTDISGLTALRSYEDVHGVVLPSGGPAMELASRHVGDGKSV